MVILQTLITVLYYGLVAYVAAILIWNYLKTRKWEQEVLYIIVLIPFLLRLFRLK
jgi:hypothetical protein